MQVARTAQRMQRAVSWPFALTFIGGAVLAVLIYREYQKHKRSDTEKEAERDVKKRELSYNDAAYYQLADSLYQAFNPSVFWGAGTDEEEVYRIIDLMQNQSDWNMLVSAFGNRNGTLPSWLTWELSNDEMQKVQKTLKEKGVTI